MMRKMAFLLILTGLLSFCFSGLAGWNGTYVATDGQGIPVYAGSSTEKAVGILYNGFEAGLSLESRNGRYSANLTNDYEVWLDQQKAQKYAPEGWYNYNMDQAVMMAAPFNLFLAEVVEADAPVYTTPGHKHVTAKHAPGTLLRICGEFGEDYYVEDMNGRGFISKEAVIYYCALDWEKNRQVGYGLPGQEEKTVYSNGESIAVGFSATGFCDLEPQVLEPGRKVVILRYLENDMAQLSQGAFIETRFLDPEGDHSLTVATVKSSRILDRLNVRFAASKDSTVVVKLCAGVQVQVTSHTEDWAAVYLSGPGGGQTYTGSAMMEYLAFGQGARQVENGCTQVLLKEKLYTGNGGFEYRASWGDIGKEALLPGTELTVIGCEVPFSDEGPDRFVCQTADGRLVVIWNDEGVLEPLEGTGITVRTNSNVRFREEPNKEAEVIRTLSSGTKVEVLLRGETWTMVDDKGTAGYVMSRYLSFP